MAPKQQTEVQMPPDGTETETNSSSPLDAEPAKPRKPQAKAPSKPAPGKRKVREFEEDIPEGEKPPELQEASPFEPDSPLDADADAATAMVEVDRIGPGEGQGWIGRNYDPDGGGAIAVSYGRVGSFPDERGIYERVQMLAGGGQYKFVRRGKPPVIKILGGAPLPLPSEQSQGGFGTQSNVHGGFERGDSPFAEEGSRNDDPFSDPNFDPSEGIDPQDIQSGGPNGWFRGGPYNRLMFLVDGRPARPPRGSRPPAQLLAGGGDAGGFNPGAFDHSPNPEIENLKKMVSEVTGKNPMADYLQMVAEQREREREEKKEEREREREQREREREEKKEEQDRLREDKREEREREREQRREDREKEREAQKAAAEAMREAAKLQAEAMKSNNSAAVEAAKEMSKMQAESSKQLITLLTQQRSEGGLNGLLDQFVKLQQITGGGDKSEAERILGLVPAIADVAVPRVVEGIQAIRGQSLLGNMGGGQQQQGSSGSQVEQDAQVRLLGVLAMAARLRGANYPPAEALKHLASSAIAADVDFEKVKGYILLVAGAPPDRVATELDKAVAGAPQPILEKAAAVKSLVLDPAGLAWVKEIAAVIQGKPQAPQIPATK